MFDQLVQTTSPAFSAMFDRDIPVKLNGIAVASLRGSIGYEEIVDSPNKTEIGQPVMTLCLSDAAAIAAYNALGKTGRYAFVVDGVGYTRRGPAISDPGGVKIYLTKA